MTARPDHIAGETYHGRHGAVNHGFRYRVDYLLLNAETAPGGPWLFGRNRWGLFTLRDRDHGGAPGHGRGAAWVHELLGEKGIDPGGEIWLLAQPRVLGHVFNPVSFWLCHDPDGQLRVVIAEVTNTFGDRHSYLCHRDDLAVIGPADVLEAHKVFHVSPFQPVSGDYAFRFDIGEKAIAIRIDYRAGSERLVATLTGPRRPLGTAAMIGAALRRPLGSRRVLALIHWQALRLWWKGATYRTRPAPPSDEVSR